MFGENVYICRYIFSTEGHLLPATPEIALVQEHCSYFGAYCNTGNIRNESQASDVPSNSQETYDGSLLYGRVRTGIPSDSSLSDSTSISGLIKVRIAYQAFLFLNLLCMSYWILVCTRSAVFSFLMCLWLL